MGKSELENLVKISQLKSEPPTRAEFDGMLASPRVRLADAQNESIDPDSQSDLAYGAVHRLALAALRLHGYRSENRFANSDVRIIIARRGSKGSSVKPQLE